MVDIDVLVQSQEAFSTEEEELEMHIKNQTLFLRNSFADIDPTTSTIPTLDTTHPDLGHKTFPPSILVMLFGLKVEDLET